MAEQTSDNQIAQSELQAFGKDTASAFLTGITAAFYGIQQEWAIRAAPLEARHQDVVRIFEQEFRLQALRAESYAQAARNAGSIGEAVIADGLASSYYQKANALLDPLVSASEKLRQLNSSWANTLEPLLSRAPSYGGALARYAGPIGDALNSVDAWIETISTGDATKLADVSFAIITAEVVGGFVIAAGVVAGTPLVASAVLAGILAAGSGWAVEKFGTGSAVARDMTNFINWLQNCGNTVSACAAIRNAFISSTMSLAADPLTLDLDGDGIETVGINASNPILFDITATGIQQSVGWVGADDGFLVRDLNGNGLIDSGAELFGDATQLSNSQTAADGFAALADLAVDTFTLQFTDSLPVSEAMNDGFWKTTLRRKA